MTRVLLNSALMLSLVFSSSDFVRAQEASSKKKEAKASARIISVENVDPGELRKVVVAALEQLQAPRVG